MKSTQSTEKKQVVVSVNKIKTEISDANFEDRILEINLKKPTRAYNFYLMEMKRKSKNVDNNITNISHEFSFKWSKLSDDQKKKYQDMEEEDKNRYQEHLSLVKKHILDKPLRESASAFTLFTDEYIKAAIEQEKDPKEARREAREKWKEMSDEQKVKYEEKKDKHTELYEALRSAKGRVSGYTLFVKDELMAARENNLRMTLIDCAEKWKKTKESIKEKYQQYADEVREERERMRDLYEITFGIKPKRPIGSYKFFMMEQAKEGKFDGKNPFKEASKLWNKLSDEHKERYQKIAKKRQLAYIVKKSEYLSIQRKSAGKASSAFNLFVADMKDKVEGELPKGGMFEYCYERWNKATDEQKKKYQKLADEQKTEFDKKKEVKEGESLKRPATPYATFYAEKYTEVKKKHPNLETSQIMKIVAENWRETDNKQKEKYLVEYQKKLKEYRDAMQEIESDKSSVITPAKSIKNSSTVKKKKTEEEQPQKQKSAIKSTGKTQYKSKSKSKSKSKNNKTEDNYEEEADDKKKSTSKKKKTTG